MREKIFLGLSGLILICFLTPLKAEEILMPNTLEKFFMSVQERQHLEHIRQIKLDQLNGIEISDTTYAHRREHKIKQPKFPAYVTVSALIRDSQGHYMARVNGHYLKENEQLDDLKLIKIDILKHQAYFDFKGRQQRIPLGYTYLTHQKKLLSTYQYLIQQAPKKLSSTDRQSHSSAKTQGHTSATDVTQGLKQVQQLLGTH